MRRGAPAEAGSAVKSVRRRLGDVTPGVSCGNIRDGARGTAEDERAPARNAGTYALPGVDARPGRIIRARVGGFNDGRGKNGACARGPRRTAAYA